MSETGDERGNEGLSAQVEKAERRLREAAEAAEAAERRTLAEVRTLEADLEKERREATTTLGELRARHEEELRGEREAKERAIAAAEGRLAEIEAEAEAAEQRIEAAERRAAEAERAVAEREAMAREAAAAWLRGQVEAIRRDG